MTKNSFLWFIVDWKVSQIISVLGLQKRNEATVKTRIELGGELLKIKKKNVKKIKY